MNRVVSLAPQAGASPRALLLGSMPGAASLAAGQYYAHPRNAFWPLMQALFGVPAERVYSERLAALQSAHVALWDVLAECERASSLDAAIRRDGQRLNPIAEWVAGQPTLTVLALNGATAASLFDRHLAALLPRPLRVLRLPSTSPAHAALPFEAKRAAWAALRDAMEASACA